jgi:hypothetical protein
MGTGIPRVEKPIPGWKVKALFTPGPLTTSRTVKQAMLRDLGSRNYAFLSVVRVIREKLVELAGARTVVEFAFTTLALNRVHAEHYVRNPASGRVMQKIGMRHEGRRRRHVKHWGVFEDLELYGILKDDIRPSGEPTGCTRQTG